MKLFSFCIVKISAEYVGEKKLEQKDLGRKKSGSILIISVDCYGFNLLIRDDLISQHKTSAKWRE